MKKIYKIYEIIRGNTGGFVVEITENNIPLEVDAMYLTVKDNWEEENVIFQKKLSSEITYQEGKYYIVINPEDTDSLEYGRYCYDIKFIIDGIEKTIEKGVFLVSEAVTHLCNEV